MSSADPAISDGFSRARAPFSSRYTLKPRLWDSPPVFQRSVARLAPSLPLLTCALNDCSLMLVAKVIVSTCVAVLGLVISLSITLAVLVAVPGGPARVRIVIVAVAPLAMVPSWHVAVPPATGPQVPVVVVA